ncbi:MAG TPA: delta-60 repeat domain-containing protein, partial [Patescibacteria group bacterium]|nr:delta-60 repeat domain-containing protein [Patescibacteria group bacterium]
MKAHGKGRLLAARMIMVMLLMAALPRQARAADGDLDTSFSFDGKLTTSFSGHGDAGHAVAIDASGRIVVAGQTSDGTHQGFGVARYNDDGTLDASFGTNGLVAITPTGFSEGANAVVFDGQGRIVLAGFVTDGS